MPSSHARRAGVCLHITSLPDPYGIGTIGASARWFVDQIANMGLGIWQVLPTGPTGYGDSPYQLLSVFAGNPMLIDLPALHERGLITCEELEQLPDGDLDEVLFGEVIAAKTTLLNTAADRFIARSKAKDTAAFDHFAQTHGAHWLDDYADYRVLKNLLREAPWYNWPAALATANPVARERLAVTQLKALAREKVIQFWFFEQWQALRQYANDKGVQLIGDVPIYVAYDSADTWSRPDLFQLDDQRHPTAVGGVPPDYFSADGQLWGNPLYAWDVHAQQGYAWWIQRMQHASTLTDLVRIDHFRGFEAYWSIDAAELTARNGHWVTGPGNALFDALKDSIEGLPIIAEDLGVITEPVNELRRRYQLPGMAVLQFLLDEPDFHPDHVEEDRVCYTGTHDNDTTVSWFSGHGETNAEHVAYRQRRVLELTGGDQASMHMDLIAMAMNTRARYAIAPMQDYLGLPTSARFNTPGTTNGNWRWRLQQEQIDDALCSAIYAMVQNSGRLAAP